MIRKPKSKLSKGDKTKYTIIALLVSIIGLVITFVSYVFPRGPAPPPLASPPLTKGSLLLKHFTDGYYPPGGKIPSGNPPDYRKEDANFHCELWEKWMYRIGAAPALDADLGLTTIANSSSSITITNIRFVVYGRDPISSNKRIKCVYQAAGEPGTSIYPDLDSPGPIPMDTNGYGSPNASLPPGDFVVEPKGASLLYMFLKGTEGYVYNYAIVIQYIENSAPHRIQFGSRKTPLHVAFDPRRSKLQYFDWDTKKHAWVHVSPGAPPNG